MCFGLLLGGMMTAGVVIGQRSAAPPPSPLEELKLHAMSAMGSENLAIATGPVDDEAEGVFFLDFLTGDLQCFVMNPRVGKFTGWFKTNIVKDLPVEKGKKPSYIISTGAWNPVRGGGIARPAQCVVYVADANTGMFAAYGFPWVRGTSSTLATQAAPMITLDGGRARTLIPE
jgi:hypothetical protein